MQIAPRTRKAMAQSEAGALSTPPAGSPMLANTARPATTSTAPRTWRRVTTCPVRK